MTHLTRRLSSAGAPLLLILSLSLTACGGDASGAPQDASKDDFCEAYNAGFDEPEGFDSLSEDDQAQAVLDALTTFQDELASVGTPEGIPDDAREGFTISIEKVDEFDVAYVKEQLASEDEPFLDIFSDEEMEKVDALEEWAQEYCG